MDRSGCAVIPVEVMASARRAGGYPVFRGYAAHGVLYLRDMPVIGEADAKRPVTLTVVDPGWSGWRSHLEAKGSDAPSHAARTESG